MSEYSMADLVCLHLQGVDDIGDEPAPYEAATPGIAEAMDLGEETIADRVDLLSALSALPREGLVEQRTARVSGVEEERNVYALTDEGERHARERREQLRDTQLVVRRADGETEVPVAAIDDYLDADVGDPVVAALARAEGDVLVLEDEYSPDDEGQFVDRTAELATLEDRFECALSGDPQTVFVCGEPGVGKTTLVREFETDRADRHTFLYGRCQSDVSEPYQPFLTAFEDLAGADSERLTPLLTETPGVEAADRDALEAQRRTQFYELGTELGAIAAEQPVVLFIDDLQWVDRSTALLFASLARRVERGQLLLVGACRPETATGDWPLADVLDELDDGAYEWLDLDRLDRTWTGRLVRQAVGSLNVPEQFVDALYERTDGNPLFVTESVTHMLETRDVDPDLGVYPKSPDELPVPEAVERTVRSRFDVLDGETSSLLELGSAIGDTIPREVLEAASDLDEAALLDYAGILVGSGVWRYEDGQETLYFESGVVRETIQDSIADDRWRRLHRRVADAYRTLEETDAGAIAHHYREADDPSAALEYYQRAGERATDVYAHEVAIDAYERALELARELDRDHAVMAILEELGDIYGVLDEYDDAMRCYEFVGERTDHTERRQRMYRKRASVADSMGEYDRFFEIVEAGLALADEPGASPVETARLHSLRGRGLTIQGEPDDGIACHERALEIVERTGGGDADETDERARVLNGLGTAYQSKGEIDRAIDLFEQLVEIRRDGDDKQRLAAVLLNYGTALGRAGEYDRSVEVYEQSRELYEEIGDREGIMSVLNNLGITYQYLDQNGRAIACFEDGLEIARATENKRTLALLSVNLGYAHANRAEFDVASGYAEDARRLGEGMDDPTTIVCTHEIQAFVRHYRGELDAGLDVAKAGLEIAREADAKNRIAGSLSLVGELRLARGEYGAAIDAFEEGVAQSREYGNTQKAIVNRAGLVRALVSTGEHDRAREHVDPLESVDGMVEETVPALAAYYRAAGEYDTAKARIDDGFEQLAETTKPLTECELTLAKARLDAAQGKPAEARERARRARERATEHGASLLVETADSLLGELASP